MRSALPPAGRSRRPPHENACEEDHRGRRVRARSGQNLRDRDQPVRRLTAQRTDATGISTPALSREPSLRPSLVARLAFGLVETDRAEAPALTEA
jgi:hypothetical protein